MVSPYEIDFFSTGPILLEFTYSAIGAMILVGHDFRYMDVYEALPRKINILFH